MPNINEFLNKKDSEFANLETVPGKKPCSKCEEFSDSSFWDPINFTMNWKCKNGHVNQVKVNL
jgi:hypothetical protein